VRRARFCQNTAGEWRKDSEGTAENIWITNRWKVTDRWKISKSRKFCVCEPEFWTCHEFANVISVFWEIFLRFCRTAKKIQTGKEILEACQKQLERLSIFETKLVSWLVGFGLAFKSLEQLGVVFTISTVVVIFWGLYTGLTTDWHSTALTVSSMFQCFVLWLWFHLPFVVIWCWRQMRNQPEFRSGFSVHRVWLMGKTPKSNILNLVSGVHVFPQLLST
jgi:hypothetical protein